jgi:hypothetical protein
MIGSFFKPIPSIMLILFRGYTGLDYGDYCRKKNQLEVLKMCRALAVVANTRLEGVPLEMFAFYSMIVVQ